jgi:nucleotide-binding universal stress UspA family protein
MRQILCPVDFSELSALALRHSAALANCFGSRITVLHASRFVPPPYFTPGQIARLEQEFRESEQRAQAELREFIAATLGPPPLAVEARIVDALPVEAIRRAAAETQADLIAMGTHGRSGINRLMLGSVTERVLRESRIPVLTVRGEAGAQPAAIRRILVPVNNTAVARKALEAAAELAHCFGAALTLLHVREPHPGSAIEDLCAWVPATQRERCQIEEVTREGEAAREIIAHASQWPCDLLVIGAQHRRFFDSTVMGGTTVRVVRHAPCPVLTVSAEASEVHHAV